jgi:rhodanese-related sulfurtransferase
MSFPNRARRIDVTALREQLASDDAPRVLDVRMPAEFDAAHIPGAYNAPLENLREHREELRRHLDQEVDLVCRSGNRAQLAEVGLPGLHLLDGGITAWRSAGPGVVEGRKVWDLERQVRLVAGGIVAASVLSSTVAPSLKCLAGGIGAGLVAAAATNTCAMGMALSKMPWHRRAPSCDIDQVVEALSGQAA